MTLVRFLRPLAAALLLVSLCSSPARGQVGVPPAFDSFYVFGDSLADNGNVWLTSKLLIAARQLTGPAPPPSESPNLTYSRGRFSNGPVAFEYLWEKLKKPGSPALVPYISAPLLGKTGAVNFAFGGTGTPVLDQTPGGLWAPGLLGQVGLFKFGLRGKSPSKNALYAIVTGANDYRVGAFNEPMSPGVVVANIGKAVQSLYKSGAREFLVLTLPNLGCLPYTAPFINAADEPESECIAPAFPAGPGAIRPSQLTAIHNALLAQTLGELQATGKLQGATVRLVDVNDVFDGLREFIDTIPSPELPFPLWALPALDVLLPPTVAGPPMSACLFVAPQLCTDVPIEVRLPDGSFATPFPLLFWDVVHPTTFAHSALADYLYERLRQ